MSKVDEKKAMDLDGPGSTGSPPSTDLDDIHVSDNADGLHRRLNNRQIQLIAIGGSIGTALFVSIGTGLAKGGPGSLLLAYTLYPCVLALVNNSLAEMTVLYPVSGGFIRLAGHFVDDALGFMAGWNFFFYEALLIPFEISALSTVISYWNPKISEPGPTAGICAAVIIIYAALNLLAVRGYGEAEFWLSGGKVILIFILFMFTFITMVGGNPQHHAYGFRSWYEPSAFLEYLSHGPKGRFEGFLAALWNAGFAVVGPEYISMVAAEAKRPRIYIKAAFKTVYFRFGLFFMGSALAVGIILPARYQGLVELVFGKDGSPYLDGAPVTGVTPYPGSDSASGSAGAAASPYVMAMSLMGVNVLPHIVNALMLTSIFSAGNTYTYCATRSLYGLALEGRAPAILRKTTAAGVPIFCFCIVMIFPFLSFLACSSSSYEVINLLSTLITAGGIIDFLVVSVTFLFYYRACQLQGLDRKSLPYCGWFQPYGAWIALIIQFVIVMLYGYGIFRVPVTAKSFFEQYTMQVAAPILFFGWKFFKGTKFVKPSEVDLVWERPIIDAYEARFTEPPTGFWREILALFGYKRSRVKAVEGGL